MQTPEHDPLFQAVAEFVSQQTGYSQNLITPETTLFGDIGVDGLDGADLLEEFANRFSVDMAGCRDKHFGPEGVPPWAPLYWLWLGLLALIDRSSTPESRAGVIPISVMELVESARRGRWEINYANEVTASG